MGQCYSHLSIVEREEISRGLACGEPVRAIARRLGRSASSISREVGRNAGRWAAYRASSAQHRAQRCAHRARRERKLKWRWLARYVGLRQMLGWSPEQIAARLKRDYPQDMRRRISHETIYAWIYIIPRGQLRRLLIARLRQHRKRRRPRYRSGERRGQIPYRTPIGLRPPDVETRRVPGHREGDLLKGRAGRSAVAALVERTTRVLLLARLPGLDSRAVCGGIARKLSAVPQPLRQSLTYDQGREMARHELLRKRLKLQTYFADPRSPWQRGTSETTNGLLRQYLPRHIDLSRFSQRDLNVIAARLNNRPRKTLDWMTPNEAWAAQLKSSNVALGT